MKEPITLADITPEKLIAEGGFLCGSRAYGSPRDDSDTDVVVLVTESQVDDLIELADAEDEDSPDENCETYDGSTAFSLRFGSLNLICFTEPDVFNAWKSATESLIEKRPVTREQAVEAIQAAVALAYHEIGVSMQDFFDDLPPYEGGDL